MLDSELDNKLFQSQTSEEWISDSDLESNQPFRESYGYSDESRQSPLKNDDETIRHSIQSLILP